MRPLQKDNFTFVCVHGHLMADKLKYQKMPKLELKIIFNNKKLPNLSQITCVNNINNIQAHSSTLGTFKMDKSIAMHSELFIAAHSMFSSWFFILEMMRCCYYCCCNYVAIKSHLHCTVLFVLYCMVTLKWLFE